MPVGCYYTVPCPHNWGFFNILRPYSSTPITNGQKVFWKAWIPLKCIDWTEMSIVNCRYPFIYLLSLFITSQNRSFISQLKYKKFRIVNRGMNFIEICRSIFRISCTISINFLPLSVPTINLVGIVGSNSRQDTPCAFWISLHSFSGSRISTSVGSVNLRISHHFT